MFRPPTKFRELENELRKRGVRQQSRKLRGYLLSFARERSVQDVTAQQWQDFFHEIDRMRDLREFPALIQCMENLQELYPAQSTTPSQSTPSFSAKDLEFLHDAGISPEEDVRVPSKYWRPL